jgi:hypothetical protein
VIRHRREGREWPVRTLLGGLLVAAWITAAVLSALAGVILYAGSL